MTNEEKMTPEEAIAYGKECLSWNKFSKDMKMYQFIEMAIKALSQEPCDDAIDRAEAMTEIMMFAGNVKPDEEDIYIKVSDAVQLLRELPSVTQKSGKWIDYRDDGFVECPFCGHATNCEDDIDELHYCFYCGAKMESEDKE